jgi:hypothetical protein
MECTTISIRNRLALSLPFLAYQVNFHAQHSERFYF